MNTKMPRRGDIWLINVDPTVGAEIQKTRPAVVLSSDALGKLPLKIIVPITDWKDYFEENVWHVKIEPEKETGLRKISAVDTLQVRSVDTKRFLKRIGICTKDLISEITSALVALIEHQSNE